MVPAGTAPGSDGPSSVSRSPEVAAASALRSLYMWLGLQECVHVCIYIERESVCVCVSV